MWNCENCSASGNPSGFQKTKLEVEAHLNSDAWGNCRNAWYTYGGENADRTKVYIVKQEDGILRHQLSPECGWEFPHQEDLIPRRYIVMHALTEAARTVTFVLMPEGYGPKYKPGQFAMVNVPSWAGLARDAGLPYTRGSYFGEIPISVSGIGPDGAIAMTIRRVGPLSNRLTRPQPGDKLTLRGPYGKGWNLEDAEGHDVLLIAGGCGLAPLRPAIWHIMDHREDYGKVTVLYGAKTERDLLYASQLAEWPIEVKTITEPGLVTDLLDEYDAETRAFVCGPEPMMLAVGRHLQARGVTHIQVSVERKMECGIGECGVCKLPDGQTACKDGPVFEFDRVRKFLADGSFERSIRQPRTKLAGLFGGGCPGKCAGCGCQ